MTEGEGVPLLKALSYLADTINWEEDDSNPVSLPSARDFKNARRFEQGEGKG